MNAKDTISYDLDDVLFAKFAELDQKVAMLREEMDGIAMLLERRKRMRDSSQSISAHMEDDSEIPPQWIRLEDAWEVAPPNQDNSSPFARESDQIISGRLYDADLPNEHEQQAASCCRVGSVTSPRVPLFHPYRRPTNQNDPVLSPFFAAKRTSLPAFFLSDFQELAQNELLVDQDDCAEDPPSDPDDSIDTVKGD